MERTVHHQCPRQVEINMGISYQPQELLVKVSGISTRRDRSTPIDRMDMPVVEADTDHLQEGTALPGEGEDMDQGEASVAAHPLQVGTVEVAAGTVLPHQA